MKTRIIAVLMAGLLLACVFPFAALAAPEGVSIQLEPDAGV